MARKNTGPTVAELKDTLVSIYEDAESWDGSRGDAQSLFDNIQDSINEVFPEAADLASEDLDEVDDSDSEE